MNRPHDPGSKQGLQFEVPGKVVIEPKNICESLIELILSYISR